MEEKLPTIVCSSVIRSSKQGESHGGIYLVNLETEEFKLVVDWNNSEINWEGRGADRGLRGISFYNDMIVTAASDEIFFFDKDFRIIKSFKNRYLKHCHEIYIEKDLLYLSSTGFDSILLFDLQKEEFNKGFCYRKGNAITNKYIRFLQKKMKLKLEEKAYHFFQYDPKDNAGPPPLDSHHINNVFVKNDEIYFSGTMMRELMKISSSGEESVECEIPEGTHNVQFFKEGLLYNHTSSDEVIFREKGNQKIIGLKVITYDDEKLEFNGLSKDHARQGFGRGLCTFGDLIIGGSSPSTISVYSLKDQNIIKTINLTNDIRNAIHGLEVY